MLVAAHRINLLSDARLLHRPHRDGHHIALQSSAQLIEFEYGFDEVLVRFNMVLISLNMALNRVLIRFEYGFDKF